MPATPFPAPVNDLATTLAGARTVGGSTLTLASGAGTKITTALAELGYGSPSSIKPLRVTVTKATYTGRGDISVIQATGLTGDVLNGCTVVEGTPDQAFAVGDVMEVDPTAGVIKAIEDAINALETATIDASAITTGTLAVARGGTGQSAYTDGQLLIGNTATGGLAKASLTAGTNITITPGNGSITIAAAGGGGTPGGANTQIQVNGAGAFAGYASFTYNSTTFVQTIGDATGAAQLTLNNNTNNNPTIKVNSTSSQQGLTIVVGAATVAQFHDTGLLAAGSFGTLGGMNFGDFFVQRASGPKVDFGGGLGSTVAVMVTDPSANAGYNYTLLVAGSRAAAVSGAVSGFSGQTTDIWQVTKNDQSVYWANDKLGRPYSKNTTATIAAGAGAGTTPTVSVAGTDVNGVVTVTTGTTPGASAVVATVSFSVALTQAGTNTIPKTVILTPANAAASALSGAGKVWADSAALAAASFTLNSGSVALTAATTYKWYYLAVG
jgi:hypothetical protein